MADRKKTMEVPEKIKRYDEILKKTEDAVNRSLQRMGVSVSKFRFNSTYSAGANDRTIATKLSFKKSQSGMQSDITLNLNTNVKRLLQFPSLEVYSVLSALSYNAVLGGMSKADLDKVKNNYGTQTSSNDLELQKVSDRSEAHAAKSNYEVAKWLIQEYLKDFLPSYFGENAEISKFEMEFISGAIAETLLSSMPENQISKVPSLFFKFKTFDEKAIKEGKKYFETGSELSENLSSCRTAKVLEDAKSLSADPEADFSDAKALGANEQFLALSSTFASKKQGVKDALSGGFNNQNESLKQFCREYANSFMASNNLSPIDVEFVNSGSCRYSDGGGTKHSIKINLSAPEMREGSITELLMTMSHELTHAVDSTINKLRGESNQYGGGLIGTMSGNLSACDAPKGSDAYKLLKRVQGYCYQLDPNERHGRIGELSALKFMQEIYAGDPEMEAQMKESIAGYNKYQMKTINTAKSLPNRLAEFRSALSSCPGISSYPKAYQMIEERINYLEDINKNLNIEAEQNSVKDALEIADGRTQQTHRAKTSEEEMLLDEEAARKF